MILIDAVRGALSFVARVARQPPRHIWRAEGRVHIEVHGAHRPGREEFVAAVERALRDVEGVDWAELNAAVAHVVVAFDPETVEVDELVDAVQSVEDAFGVGDDRLDETSQHPGGPESVRLALVEIGADVGGIVVGFVGRAVRLPLVPIELAAALPVVDSLPAVRSVLERHRVVEAALTSANAVVQGLAQGPNGLVVDAAHRVVLLREAVAVQRGWERAEPRLHAGPGSAASTAIDRIPRPVPLPEGPIERYARRVAFGSLGVGAAALLLTSDPRKAADVIIAAMPRAARLGREAFGAQTACALTARDVVVMDRRALRRLDRIDTVVVEAELFDRDPAGASSLAAAIRGAAQDFVMATSEACSPANLDDTESVITARGGMHLAESVRSLQAEGRVVALVAAGSGEALAAADCGIGVIEHAVPWGAHLLCADLFDAAVVIDATAAARVADRRVLVITGVGSVVAGAAALGPPPRAARRMVTALNAASLVAMGAGLWTAGELSGQRPSPVDDDPTSWHAMPAPSVMTELGTSESGLASSDAGGRTQESADADTPGLGRLFVTELSNPLTALLGVGGVVSTMTGSLSDGLLITGVVGVNALVGAIQRQHAEGAIRQLATVISSRVATVRRDDQKVDLPPDQVVRGDILVLQAGDVVPADARVVSAAAVETDESSLTGESFPVAKVVEPVPPDTGVAERRSMLYAGTVVAAGRAEAAVVAIGDATEARRGAVNDGQTPRTGVQVRLDELMRKTVPVVLGAGALVVGSTVLRGASLAESVATGVSLAAAAVPEGLPFLATVAQSAAARRLSREGVLVRNPQVLEALGRADVLCFDKTGTLTEGRLQVRVVSDGEITEVMPLVDGRRRLVLAAGLRATPAPRGGALPHPTDQAIVDATAALEIPRELGAPGWQRTTSLPFSSTRSYHAVLGNADGTPRLVVKGAPEALLPRCTEWRRGDRVVEVDDATRRRLERAATDLAAEGLRILAVAERAASGRRDLDDARITRLQLLGFVAVADVVRSSAVDPISMLQSAGITVVMLTGDHPVTASAIGADLGLLDADVVTGVELDDLDDDQLLDVLRRTNVFARVTPVHKVRIVKGYQQLGRVVAMTGDGANDAQAIRLADVGIAFGPRATPAARASADLVIVDDRVETLIASIVEGRAMWASVRDALALLLGGNLGEVIFTTGATLVAGRSPLNARQLLAVNLLTDLAPALAIALQRPPTTHVDLRTVGPEDSLGGQLTREIAVRAAATAAGATGAWTAARITGTPTRAGTVALVALVGAQLGQTLLTGHRSPLVVGSCLLSAGALVAIVQTPGVSQFFGSRPLGPVGWTIAGGSATLASAGALVASRLLPRA